MSTAVLDQVCADAVELARAAVLDEVPAEQVGDWLEARPDGDRVVTHYFQRKSVAYADWRWAVTVARAPRSRTPTVDEVLLLPGPTSLLAPEWVPYEQRIAAGDLGVGDLHPTAPDDVHLVPGGSGEDALEAADEHDGSAPLRPEQWELGLGRVRVLSAWGREDAAQRWNEGDFGPESEMAKAAPGHCGSCGFLLPVGGALGQQFGLCANEISPADGRVVDLGYGCGAHSEAPLVLGTAVPVSDGVVDDVVYDLSSNGDQPPTEPKLFVIAEAGAVDDLDPAPDADPVQDEHPVQTPEQVEAPVAQPGDAPDDVR